MMYNIVEKKLLFIFIIILVMLSFSILYSNNDISSVKCIGTTYNRTCIYKNIYYQKGVWIVINIPNNRIKCVAVRSRSTHICFKPMVKKKAIKYDKVIENLSTYINFFYASNVGHLMWDDLYSLYLSFLKFGYKMNPFNIIISRIDSYWKNNSEAKIFEMFSMNKLIYESDFQNDVILIKKLVVGLGHQCQRCVNKEYSIAGGKEYKATWWMRKRMYYVYNVTKCKNRYAIIVDNKRYTDEEKKILHNITKIYNNSFNMLYIDWRKYPLFLDQLTILSCANIYISGPGTGLLNFPFIPDPGIIINLGGLFRGCPSFMEQYIEEGSMHFISLYYPSIKRKYGIKQSEIKLLIDKAIHILNNWSFYKLNHKSNLNIEGELFKKISQKNPKLMDKFLSDTDWAKDIGFGVWAEKLIYFPLCYNLSYIVDAVVNETNLHKNKLGCEISNSYDSCLVKES